MGHGFPAGVVTCLPGIGSPSPAQTPWGRAHRAIEAGYLRLFSASGRRDSAAFAAQLAPEFTAEFPDGHQLDAQATAVFLQEQWRSVEEMEIGGSISRLKVRDGQAEVLIRQETRTVAVDAEGRRLRLVVTEDFGDTWSLAEDGWRLQARRLLTIRALPA